MTSIIQSISEVAKPVRRRLYQVPVVVLKPASERSQGYYHLNTFPVLGPAHADPELNTARAHYHIDWRFVDPAIRRAVNDDYGLGKEKGVVVWAADVLRTEEQALPFRLPAVAWPTWDKAVRPTLERLFASARLKPGLICPHKGGDLSHCPADENGVVECPLHGLRWNIHSGELVPAVAAPRS